MNFYESNWSKIDIIGDIHGCWEQLEELLGKLGYKRGKNDLWEHSEGRKLVFVGDIVDKGPQNWKCLSFMKKQVQNGTAICTRGNHDDKLGRFFKGNPVKVKYNLKNTLEELKNHIPEEKYQDYSDFLLTLPLFATFDGGKVAITHAAPSKNKSGLQKNNNLYGFPTGKRTKEGYPERIDWVGAYDSSKRQQFVVYGHVMYKEARLSEKTCGIDTGCCVGNKLSAFRWPEKEVISVENTNKELNYTNFGLKGAPTMKSFVKPSKIRDMNLQNLLKKFKKSEEEYLSLIDEDEMLIKRQNKDGLVIANASNSLYMPEQEHQLFAKGIVYKRNPYELVSLPLIKMFNYNNNECDASDQLVRELEKKNIAMALPLKEDGTMIQLFEHNKEVYLSTRGVLEGGQQDLNSNSFNFIHEARQILKEKYPELLKSFNLKNKTLVFELIHPDNRIVTNYGDKKDLILLSVFNHAEFRYLTNDKLFEFASSFKLETPEILAYCSPHLFSEEIKKVKENLLEKDKVYEGTVVCFETNNQIIHRVKIKTEEYLNSFKIKYHCNYKNAVEKMLLECSGCSEEEFINYLKEENELEEEIEEDYRQYYRQYKDWRKELRGLKAKVKNIVKNFDNNTKKTIGTSEYYKEAALYHKKNHSDIFSLLMTEHRNGLTELGLMKYNEPHAGFGSTLVKLRKNKE